MYQDAPRVARIDFVAVIVLKVNAEVVNVLALLQIGNVILMFVGIVGSGEVSLFHGCCVCSIAISFVNFIPFAFRSQ